MDADEQDEIYSRFNEAVNMAPEELADWLETEESQSVGDTGGTEGGGAESTGHKSGRRIVEIKRTKKAELSDGQYEHMRKVTGYVHRHLAQKPSGDIEHSNWRHSLMNWGHDPLKGG